MSKSRNAIAYSRSIKGAIIIFGCFICVVYYMYNRSLGGKRHLAKRITPESIIGVDGHRRNVVRQTQYTTPKQKFVKSIAEPSSDVGINMTRPGPNVPTSTDVSAKGNKPIVGQTPVKQRARITSLVDIPTNFNFTHTQRHVNFTILWYNPAKWIVRRNKNLKMDTCEYNNCQVTEDRKLLGVSSAVVFGISMGGMVSSPPVSHSRRNPDQIWIFYSLEPPIYHIFQTAYKSRSWHNTMNWSMTFNLDSDVFAPYGTFKIRHGYPEKNYDKLFNMKTKMALWAVSNCGSMSRRQEFVSALRSEGVQVDIYGACGEKGRYQGDIGELAKHYKFYLSLENSFCKYYVTEKVIGRHEDDAIIVIRGGADYSRMIPENTYVDAGMFANVTSLAKHLIDLSSNRQRYIEMLRRKDRYYTLNEDEFGYPFAMCELCRKLNQNDGKRKTYSNLEEAVLREGQCKNPKDIIIR